MIVLFACQERAVCNGRKGWHCCERMKCALRMTHRDVDGAIKVLLLHSMMEKD